MLDLNAVILGGGKSPVNNNLPKGNTPYGESSLAGNVYDALIHGYNFKRIALVMNPDKRIPVRTSDIFVEPTFYRGAWLSGFRGVKAIDDGSSDYVLIAGDLPFLSDKIISEFIRVIQTSKDADIILPLVTKELNQSAYQERTRTYQPLQEGEFLAGNLGYLSQKALRKNESRIESIALAYRKNFLFALNIINQLGLLTLLRSNHRKLPFIRNIPYYERLFPRLSLHELEEIASEFTGVNVKLAVFPHPEVAFDIDNIRQLELAENLSRPGSRDLEGRLVKAS